LIELKHTCDEHQRRFDEIIEERNQLQTLNEHMRQAIQSAKEERQTTDREVQQEWTLRLSEVSAFDYTALYRPI
jgi:regulator of replication initiation timing